MLCRRTPRCWRVIVGSHQCDAGDRVGTRCGQLHREHLCRLGGAAGHRWAAGGRRIPTLQNRPRRDSQRRAGFRCSPRQNQVPERLPSICMAEEGCTSPWTGRDRTGRGSDSAVVPPGRGGAVDDAARMPAPNPRPRPAYQLRSTTRFTATGWHELTAVGDGATLPGLIDRDDQRSPDEVPSGRTIPPLDQATVKRAETRGDHRAANGDQIVACAADSWTAWHFTSWATATTHAGSRPGFHRSGWDWVRCAFAPGTARRLWLPTYLVGESSARHTRDQAPRSQSRITGPLASTCAPTRYHGVAPRASTRGSGRAAA